MTRRVTLREAARVLGISKEAVRKRVKRETLAHEKKDDVVYVFLPDGSVYLPAGGDAGTDTGTDAGGDAPDQQSEKSSAHFADEDEEPAPNSAPISEPKDDRDERIAELQETVRDLRERLDRAEEAIREHLDHAEEANRENRRIIAGLIERLPSQLEPPRDEPGAPETVAEDAEEVEDRGEPTEAQGAGQKHSGIPERPREETPRRPWWRRIFRG